MARTRLTSLLLISMVALVSGCTKPKGNWGESVDLPPWDKVARAAIENAVDPLTWAPLAGAAVFSINDWDENTTEWAAKENPIFGNQLDAGIASDDLRTTAGICWGVTALATPSGDTAQEWAINKLKGGIIQGAAIGITSSTTSFIKDTTQRERPTGGTKNSFPSGHTSQATVRATMAAKNLDYIDMPEMGRSLLRTGFYTVAAGTAWARVEANRHYPSDVLAGFALGHFVGGFLTDAFIAPWSDGAASIDVEAEPDSAFISSTFVF
ncbi:MAG: phosphatase PAP2 family protein [Magnetococcales bacterium]|nr:phosphatase PAP2 family protein [Magnetococcales bacterium]